MSNVLKLMEEQVVRQMKTYHHAIGTKPWDYQNCRKRFDMPSWKLSEKDLG